MTTKTLTGPNGIRIELDASQVFPADPGAGTPAMVYMARESATYWCALDTGELDGRKLRQPELDWLESQIDTVEAFIDAHSN